MCDTNNDEICTTSMFSFRFSNCAACFLRFASILNFLHLLLLLLNFNDSTFIFQFNSERCIVSACVHHSHQTKKRLQLQIFDPNALLNCNCFKAARLFQVARFNQLQIHCVEQKEGEEAEKTIQSIHMKVQLDEAIDAIVCPFEVTKRLDMLIFSPKQEFFTHCRCAFG